MQVLIVLIIIVVVLRFLGKMIWNNEDRREVNSTPNHPSNISESKYPIGSGSCSKRNGDRHIWHYGENHENIGPTSRDCKFCGRHEWRFASSSDWRL